MSSIASADILAMKPTERTARAKIPAMATVSADQASSRVENLVFERLLDVDEENRMRAQLAKSWSVFDYIARKEGRRGLLFLKSFCSHARDRQKVIPRWREDAREIFETGAKDPFRELEARWRQFAERGQKKDSSRRGTRRR